MVPWCLPTTSNIFEVVGMNLIEVRDEVIMVKTWFTMYSSGCGCLVLAAFRHFQGSHSASPIGASRQFLEDAADHRKLAEMNSLKQILSVSLFHILVSSF